MQKTALSSFSKSKRIFTLVDTVERLRAISNLTEADWLDLLDLSWKKYQQFKMGFLDLPDKSLDNLTKYFAISYDKLLNDDLNFKDLAIQMSPRGAAVDDYYMVAPSSRRRTTINSINFLEHSYGWRLRQDVLKTFGIKEEALLDPFAQISMRLITDVCAYLKKRQFSKQDFFSMGAFAMAANRNTLLGKTLLQMDTVQDLYHYLFNEMIFLFEANSSYSYQSLGPTEGLLIMKTIGDVARELGVSLLGNDSICELKRGFCASAPIYLGLNYAKVVHTECEHDGFDACKFHIDISPCFRS